MALVGGGWSRSEEQVEREKVLSVGPLGPGPHLPGQVRCWARGPFLAPVCAFSPLRVYVFTYF